MVSTLEMSQTLTAVLLFLAAAHLGGFVFQKLKQPIVIGEIVGGLVLGPTVLGMFFPELRQSLFVEPTRVPIALTLIYNFGLILMMFCSGLEAEVLFRKKERKSAIILAIAGTALPLALGIAFLSTMDLSEFMGPRGSQFTMMVMLGCAIAVTSLPVISRIFIDLNLIKSPFASLVLSAALIDDVILYVFMAIALTISKMGTNEHLGLLEMWLKDSPIGIRLAVSTVLHFLFMIFFLKFAARPITWLLKNPFRFILERSPTSALLAIMIFICLIGQALGVAFVLSAFCAGLLACQITEISQSHRDTLKTFSMSFFIPIYFAFVGYRLNLTQDLHLTFTAIFLVVASAIKGISIWAGAKAAGYSNSISTDLAVTMNARGGPGIVLASVAYDSQIINGTLYVTLVLLAIITSMGAGTWLQWRIKKGKLSHELT